MSDASRAPEPSESGRPKPKRGAFPTPRSEIDAATPYVPEAEAEHEEHGADNELAPPTHRDQGNGHDAPESGPAHHQIQP